jgi:pimeloyl-ACP methyl ester carboxylesterase
MTSLISRFALRLLLLLTAQAVLATTAQAFDVACPEIYWYATPDAAGGLAPPRATSAAKGDADFLDPTKPTVLLIHMSAYQQATAFDLFDFGLPVGDVEPHGISIGWLKRHGFNVAVFYWKSYALRPVWAFTVIDHADAEARLWRDEPAPFGCRTHDNHYLGDWWLPERLVDELMLAAPAAEVHWVGHSMGAQIAIKAMALMRERGLSPPTTLVQLEPAWWRAGFEVAGQDVAARHATLTLDLAHDPQFPTQIIMGQAERFTPDWYYAAKHKVSGRAARKAMADGLFDFFIDGQAGQTWLDPHVDIGPWFFSHFQEGDAGLFAREGDACRPQYPESVGPQCVTSMCRARPCALLMSATGCASRVDAVAQRRVERARGAATLWFNNGSGACTQAFGACPLDEDAVPDPTAGCF